jgi:Flp pilus assembly protein TadB
MSFTEKVKSYFYMVVTLLLGAFAFLFYNSRRKSKGIVRDLKLENTKKDLTVLDEKIKEQSKELEKLLKEWEDFENQ